MSERAVIHVVPHTHWDREWYLPFQTFRMRLVELVDGLLDRMERDPRLRFTLDGQVATVDDYLEVRPGAEPLIRRLIAEGRLAIGPWQILMDEFLVSGETIVRDLEMGWTRAQGLGGAMAVGYLPDMFGHIAQMPQILRRAGIDRAVVWRGVPAAISSNVFRWCSPDGSEVLAEYLGPGGYGNAAYLFDVPDRAAAKLVAYRAAHEAFYGGASYLAMYGTDHMVPSPRLADLVEAVNAEDSGIEVRIGTLADYAAAAPPDGREVSRWTGELRSAARANMLMGVASARIDVKIACARAERLLERYAEPLTALHGESWPERFLELAWRRVVEDSAHDSICGCSIDPVVAQVLTRFAEAEQIGRGIVQVTGRRMTASVVVGGWAVVNPSPVERKDLVTLDVPVPSGDQVAFLVDGLPAPAQEVSRLDPFAARFEMRGDELTSFLGRRRHGRELFGRMINGVRVDVATPAVTLFVDRVAQPPELDVDELLDAVAAACAGAPDAGWRLEVVGPGRREMLVRVVAPPLGWAAVEPVRTKDAAGAAGEVGGSPGAAASVPGVAPERGRSGEAGASAPPRVEHPVTVGDRALSNGLVELEVDAGGTFVLRGGGAELAGVGRIVDGGDAGDSYDYAPPPDDRLVADPTGVTVEHGRAGPLLGDLIVRRRYEWPVGLEATWAARSRVAVATDVTTRLELRADEPFVRVRVELENRSRDHRVRWHVPLPAPARASAAEGQYAVVERGLTLEGGHGEVPLPTYPARGFVHAAGVSVLLDHVLEYELVDEGSELALTLLRSFALISRNDNPYREDPAGPEVAVPAAQLLGPRSIGFGLFPHAGGWPEAGVLAAMEGYQHPFLALPGTAREAADRPGRTGGLEVRGEGIVMTALRRRGDELELRLVAEHPDPTVAVVRGGFGAARRVDLLGRDLGPLALDGPELRLPLEAWEIATVRLR